MPTQSEYLETAIKILGSSLTGHFPQSEEQARESITNAGWTDEDVKNFVHAQLPLRRLDPDAPAVLKWDFAISTEMREAVLA